MNEIKFVDKCYRLYEQKMFQVAYSILRDEDSAEDAVQEAFLKLMKSKRCFDDVHSDDCKRYIITVIRHSAITMYNRKKREFEVVSGQESEEEIKGSGGNENREKIMEWMQDLPTKYYEVVDCLVLRDMSVRETAHELRISEANVRKRYERAKVMLKKIVKGEDEYEKKYQTDVS